MFSHLKKYKKIFVVGLGRSGTRIATKMIAHDTDKTFIDETEWGIFEIDKLKYIDKYTANFVVQANCAYHIMPYFSKENTLIVFVKRDIKEINKSWERLKEIGSMNKTWTENNEPELHIPFEERLELWNKNKDKLINLIEINYEDLKAHPLWVDKKDRKDFLWNQTQVEQFTNEESKILK